MNLAQILLHLQDETEVDAKAILNDMGVDEAIHPHILGSYDQNRKLIFSHDQEPGDETCQAYEATYEVKFKARVPVPEGTPVWDAVSNINIPENFQCSYVVGSFEVEKIVDQDGNEVKL